MQITSNSAHNNITKILNKQTNILINEIDEINKEIILQACICNTAAIDDNNRINLIKIVQKDNYEAPGIVMIGNGRAKSLKKNIQNYKAFLIQFANDNKTDIPLSLSELLNTDIKDFNGQMMSWEEYHFEHLPMIQVIQALNTLKNNIIITEKEVLSQLNQKNII